MTYDKRIRLKFNFNVELKIFFKRGKILSSQPHRQGTERSDIHALHMSVGKHSEVTQTLPTARGKTTFADKATQNNNKNKK